MPASSSLSGLLLLMRPAEWSKSLGNMVLAAIIASFVLSAHLSVALFIAGFVSIAILWSGLYALNDYTDWRKDAMHPVKKNRPIPSGLVSPPAALLFSLSLLALSFAIALLFSLGALFIICLLAMVANQLLYTMKPFSFKQRPVLDLASGAMVNPLFRYYAGWVLFVPAFNSPLLPLLFIVGLQFGGYGLYRLSAKGFEGKRSIGSSAMLFGEKKLKRVYYIALAVAGLSYLAMCLNSVLRFRAASLGFLPLPFLALAAAMLLAAPFYKTALTNPQHMDLRRMYWMVYAQNLLFIAGMVGLYLFL
jgi:4-hydroxybenzoate polyprenyltransferase